MYSTTAISVLCAALFAVATCDEFAADGAVKIASKIVLDCINKAETMTCFKLKTVKFMDRLIKYPEDVPLNDFVTLKRTDENEHNITSETGRGASLSDEELDASLPRQFDEKNKRLDYLLWQKLQALLETRTITLHAPIEGRGHKDKGYKGKGAMIMMMGGMMMKMMMMGSSMLSVKALMMAKAALILAGIVALKKLGGGGGDSHPQVVLAHGSSTGGGGGGYYRQDPADAHGLAYGSQPQGYY